MRLFLFKITSSDGIGQKGKLLYKHKDSVYLRRKRETEEETERW